MTLPDSENDVRTSDISFPGGCMIDQSGRIGCDKQKGGTVPALRQFDNRCVQRRSDNFVDQRSDREDKSDENQGYSGVPFFDFLPLIDVG